MLVGTRGLIAISRAHHGEIWDETQRWNGLNGLMGGAILSDLNLSKLARPKTGPENNTPTGAKNKSTKSFAKDLL